MEYINTLSVFIAYVQAHNRIAACNVYRLDTIRTCFQYRNILKGEFNEITALVVRGHAVWLGTRSGYLFLLDASAIENQEQESAIKGFQYCGEGRVKGITPFPSSLKVRHFILSSSH